MHKVKLGFTFFWMKYKILCSDLDGTLLSSKSDVSDFTISEISRIKQKLKVILVSARMPRAMTYLQERMGLKNEPMICYNGALVMDGKNEISSAVIELGVRQGNLQNSHGDLILKLDFTNSNEWYASENTDFIQKEILYTRTRPVFKSVSDTFRDWKERELGAHKLMLMGRKGALDLIYEELRKVFDSQLLLYRSNDILIEVAPQHTSKLLGIQKLLKDDQTLDDIIAFGDNYNDIEMLRGVGCAVAVGNARNEVKAISDYITLNNTEDGVAHFIRKYL